MGGVAEEFLEDFAEEGHFSCWFVFGCLVGGRVLVRMDVRLVDCE